MGRVITAGIVGMIILFVWSATWWMGVSTVLMPHKAVADADAIRTVVADNVTEAGLYWIPPVPVPLTEENQTAWMELHEEGPVGYMVVNPEGRPAMSPMRFIMAAVLMFASTLMAAGLLSTAACGGGLPYVKRVGFVIGLGVFATITIHGIEWNFMGNPLSWTLFKAGDILIGWTLVGLVIGAIVKGSCGPK